MACRSLQNFIVVLKQKVYLFPFLSISKTIAFGGSPPRTFATPNTSIHFIFSFFVVASATAVLLHSYRGGCCGETSQDKSEQVRMFVHPFTSIGSAALGVRTTHFYDFGHRLSVIVDTVVT